ncbi:MAG: protein-tyrosine-phosphatase [Acidobacteria bacterium RIFCSPLOWO2_02_FULL_68_18]|nr:MAG: protein-tyrosine-phosphatase [Acidobacteria bacterium RIFCSPLOWO2_02_FULL_68_18]OFW51293.1 MAG: protein-tyrosine-phosphatase [Acidobacteria bacterium RIFCSPLOWO2_12_FULL_68_19]
MIHVLFVCTGNAARSIMAEAMLNDPALGRGRFRAFSAGSHPRGEVYPLALDLLREHGVPVEGPRSKSWHEFTRPEAPPLDLVITVCDHAAGERCPVWPGRPADAHWSVPDPAAVAGGEAERRQACRDAMRLLRARLERLARLPVDALTRDALERQVREIGAV